MTVIEQMSMESFVSIHNDPHKKNEKGSYERTLTIFARSSTRF